MIRTPRCRNLSIITDKITAGDIVAQQQENKAPMRRKAYSLSGYRTVTPQKVQLSFQQFSVDHSKVTQVVKNNKKLPIFKKNNVDI